MKNYYFIAAAALLSLAACTKNEVRPISGEPQEITFQTVVGSASTKTLISSMDYPTDVPFGAYAYMHTDAYNGTDNEYISNAEIKYFATPTPASWHADKTYYWPKGDDKKLTFFAYSPYSISAGTTSPVSCSAEKGIKISNWDVRANSTVDVLVADVAKDKTVNETGKLYTGVPTVFKHKLTQIAGFTVKTKQAYPDITITVKSISIKGAKYVGTYEQENWSATDVTTDYIWYNSSKASAVTYAITKSADALSIDPNELSDENNIGKYLLVLPQEFVSGAQQLEIVYNVNNGVYDYDVTATKDLKDITDGATTPTATVWEKNKKVSYTITIGLNEILWDPTVVDWDPINGSIEL